MNGWVHYLNIHERIKHFPKAIKNMVVSVIQFGPMLTMELNEKLALLWRNALNRNGNENILLDNQWILKKYYYHVLRVR